MTNCINMSKNATPPKKKTSGVNLFFVIHGYGVVPVFFQIGLFRYIKIAEHEPSKKNLTERESRMVHGPRPKFLFKTVLKRNFGLGLWWDSKSTSWKR